MSITALKSEIDTDPLARGYAGMTDAQVADSLNVVDRAATQRVSHTKYLLWLAQKGRRADIETAAASQANKAAKGIALLARDLIQMTDVDYDRGDHLGLLQALEAVGVIDATAVAEMDNQADITVSRADELNLGKVREGTVARARAI